MPPTIGGNHVPYDSGQSGTASAESVDVTNPPAIKRKKVATAVTTAKMCMGRIASSCEKEARPARFAAANPWDGPGRCIHTAHGTRWESWRSCRGGVVK